MIRAATLCLVLGGGVGVGGGVGCSGDAPAAPADAAPPDAKIVSAERPGKRSDVGGVADPASGLVVLFGGDDGPIVNQIPRPVYLGDTWLFRPGFGWEQAMSTDAPSPRGRHAVALDAVGGRMLLHGGRFRAPMTTGDYTLHGDLWAFDFSTRAWTALDDGSGTAPEPRYFAAAAFDATAGTFYLHGGGLNRAPLSLRTTNDVWAYDAAGWRELSPTGTPPSTRLFVAYTHDSRRNRLVVFGGQVGDFVSPGLSDLYALDLGTLAWTRLHDGGSGAPSGRFSSLMTYDAAGDRYLITGGHADPGVVNDVWAFSPETGSWTELAGGDRFTGGGLGCLGNPQEIPAEYVEQDLSAPERRSGGVLSVLGASAWLVGGESDCGDHLDDTWRFDLGTLAWEEILAARSGESCARRNDACSCLCL